MSAPPARILLVDDRRENLEALGALLSDLEGADVHSARSGREALELLLAHEFALALLDVQMPEMHGFELASLMRSSERTKHVPIIFVTAHSPDEGGVFAGYEAGGVDFLSKPIDPHVLRSKVRTFLELYRYRRQLAREVQERDAVVAALRSSEEALREADRRKNEFLSVLSHELRNPLAPIRNSLFILSRAAPGSDAAKRAQAVIGRQVSHLTRLVDDLLDVTRVSRGKITLQRGRTDLADVVRRTVDDHRPMFGERGLAVELDEPSDPLWVDGDATRLAQIVGNLLQNAAKFTPAGGRVHVRSGAQDGTALVTVSDTGVGMPPPLLAQVFEPFVQAESTLHRSRGGLGLGLSLVKALVELHGGTVEARSAGEGRGSEFTVRLPIAVEEADRDEAVAAPRSSPSRRVLVVEDSVDAAETMRTVLEMSGHDVDVAHDGRAGLEKVRSMRPDVVFCDIGLPVMNGYEVARAVRADPAIARTYLVAVTGYALPEDQERAFAAGFDRHIGKPVAPERLTSALEEARGGGAERAGGRAPLRQG